MNEQIRRALQDIAGRGTDPGDETVLRRAIEAAAQTRRRRHVRITVAGMTVILVISGLAVALATGSSHPHHVVSATRTTNPPSQGTPSVSAADLRKFRDAAADAPYWHTVRWIPPSSVQQAVGNTSAVVVGTVRSARVDQPRADDLIPFEGAPTLYHLEVIVDIDDTRVVAGQVEGNVVQARIPVLSGPAEGLAAAGRVTADRIVAAAPENAVGVFLISRTSGTAKPVAFQSSTGELVAFYSSMDEAVAPLDIERLAEELAAAVPRTGIAGSETTQLLGPEERELPAHLALGRRTIPPPGLEEWEGLPVIAAPTDGEGPTTCSHAHGERVLRFETPEAVVVGVYGSDEAPSACMYRSDGAEVTECEQGISFYAREPTEYQLSLCRPNRLPSSGIVWLAWADVPDGASVLLQYRGAYWLAYSVTGESIVPISGHNANPFDAGKWLNRLVFINEAGDVVNDAQILYEVVS